MTFWESIELDLPKGYRGRPAARTAKPDGGRRRGADEARWGVGPGGQAQRLRAASGARQAVVKVVGYRKGRAEAGRTLNYVGKRERIDLETHRGERLTREDELKGLLDDWSTTFSTRADGRDVMHLVLSFPEDVLPATARAIARDALAIVAGGRDWAMAVHEDTGHAHVHALVRMRGPDGRQLRTTRETMRSWREATARAARERGVALEASPRWARGRGEKAERGWERSMRARGEIPRRHREAAADALSDAPTRFERLIGATNARERAALAALSWELIAAARNAEGEERARLLRLADAAARHGESLPQARTRRQALAAIAEELRAGGRTADANAVAAEHARRRDEHARPRDVGSDASGGADHDSAEHVEARHRAWLERREAARARDRDPGRDGD